MAQPCFHSIRLLHAAAWCLLSAAGSHAWAQVPPAADGDASPHVVRVHIISEFRGPKGMVALNGKLLTDYAPIIIQDFAATGIVLDAQGHILTFLSHRWVDIQSNNPRIEISTNAGQKLQGKLIGIDQRNGVAVIQAIRGKLKETPVCTQWEAKDGAVVMAPVGRDAGTFKLGEAQVVSAGTGSEETKAGRVRLAVNQPFPDISLPVFTRDHRVLGFIASGNPLDDGVAVFPIQQMLESAQQIIKSGGDIHAGWLGIFLQDGPPGVVVQRVAPDSPAQKAGLSPRDFLVRYNGRSVQNARQFIEFIQSSPVGSKAKIDINRQGNPMTLTALVEARRPQPIQNRISLNSPRPLIGLDTIVLTPDLADALQMPGQAGLLVIDVVPQTPAARAGVLQGDVITAMDGQPIFDAPSFASYWQSHDLGSLLVLTVLRKGAERSITIQVRK